MHSSAHLTTLCASRGICVIILSLSGQNIMARKKLCSIGQTMKSPTAPWNHLLFIHVNTPVHVHGLGPRQDLLKSNAWMAVLADAQRLTLPSARNRLPHGMPCEQIFGLQWRWRLRAITSGTQSRKQQRNAVWPIAIVK